MKKLLSIAFVFMMLFSLAKPEKDFSTSHLQFLQEQNQPQESNPNSNLNSQKTLESSEDQKKEENLAKLLNLLYSKMSASQSQSNKSFRSFPPRNAEIKGLFNSFIHLNFIDEQNSFIADLFRNKFAASDMNMFVTNFVLCSILEAYPFANDLQADAAQKEQLQSQIAIALEGLSEFRDRNYADNVPVYNFWRQQLVNGTWSQAPETMLNLIKVAPHFPKFFIDFLRTIKLGNIANFLEVFDFMTQIFMYAFRIPPDADDTSVNMALTGLLYKLQGELGNVEKISNNKDNDNEKLTSNKSTFENLLDEISKSLGIDNLTNKSNAKENKNLRKGVNNKGEEVDFNAKLSDWYRNNSDYESLFKTLKMKAYRPFLNNNFSSAKNNTEDISETADVIDPRTYFVIRKFLEQKFSREEDLILPTTWLHDFKDEQKEFPLVTMPFRVNNIDFNVVTNFLYGTTNLIINHPDKSYVTNIFDAEMQQMYSDTVDLVVFAIQEDILNWRPDLALLYYPSVFDFYWLISRVYSSLKNSHAELNAFKLIENTSTGRQSVFELLKACELKLETVLKNELTQQMSKRLLNTEDGKEAFFAEFLGNTDNYKRNEDSLFATALGLNAFINIWTKEFSPAELKNISFNKQSNNNKNYENTATRKLIFDLDTTEETKNTIEKLATHLVNNAGKNSASFEGAFFSGSVKSESSNAYYFPGNYYKFLNGTDLEDHTNPSGVDITLSTGFKGFVSQEVYEEMLKGIYFGKAPPLDFQPYSQNIFPYWSSPAMTMSVNYLALSKYRSLIR